MAEQEHFADEQEQGGGLAVAQGEHSIELSGAGLSVKETVARLRNIREFIASVLQDKVDFASIKQLANPSASSGDESDKKTLLLPGAEKVALYMGLRPHSVTKTKVFPGGHILVAVYCELVSRTTGAVVGYGQGECSTFESKYAYRYLPAKNPPADDFERERMKVLGLGRFRKLRMGRDKAPEWVWCERINNPNPWDEHHTVRLIADKRAFVHAIRKTAALSEAFTQDLEDYQDEEAMAEMKAAPKEPKRASELGQQTNGKTNGGTQQAAAPATSSGKPPDEPKDNNAASVKGMVESVKVIDSGKSPFCVVKLKGGIEASTFDKDQFENLKAMQGKTIAFDYTTTRKGDKVYFNLVDWWTAQND